MYFLKTGFQASFQDFGRWGFQSKGINVGGVMDTYSARLLTILLQNSEKEAVLEMHFPAPELMFEVETIIAVGGADFGATLDGKTIELFKTITVNPGSHLVFKNKIKGERAYLAIKGGFDLPEWLGSVSYHATAKIGLEITKGLSVKPKSIFPKEEDSLDSFYLGRSLHPKLHLFDKDKNAWIFQKSSDCCPPEVVEGRLDMGFIINDLGLRQAQPDKPNRGEALIRFTESVEYDFLTTESKQKLENQTFKISTTSNRMGYQLEGNPLEKNNTTELLSSSVSFGTMQLLPSGQVIVLMADCQTTGGYPRIGSVCSVDLPILAQCSAHQLIYFQKITLKEALELQTEQEKAFKKLKAGINIYQKTNGK